MLAFDNSFIGIDVSKSKIDISFSNQHFCIKNASEAIACFIQDEIISKMITPRLVCVESTGGYEIETIRLFQASNIPIHCAHPNRVHSFAKASGHFAKTDKLDAKLLQKYAAFVSDKELGDIPITETSVELHALRSLERSLMDELHAWQCRIKRSCKRTFDYHNNQIQFILAQLEKVRADINNIIDSDEQLKKIRKILVSYKGVGQQVSSTLIADLPELGKLNHKQIASLVGVAPKTCESGIKKSYARISGGRNYVRKSIYMAALVASRHDTKMKNFYERLVAAGKPKKIALVAIMRKIVVCLNAMVRDNKMYEHFA